MSLIADEMMISFSCEYNNVFHFFPDASATRDALYLWIPHHKYSPSALAY